MDLPSLSQGVAVILTSEKYDWSDLDYGGKKKRKRKKEQYEASSHSPCWLTSISYNKAHPPHSFHSFFFFYPISKSTVIR